WPDRGEGNLLRKDVAVGQLHSFRLAGGAAGVEEEGDVLALDGLGGKGAGKILQSHRARIVGKRLVVEDDDALEAARRCDAVLLRGTAGETDASAGVPQAVE